MNGRRFFTVIFALAAFVIPLGAQITVDASRIVRKTDRSRFLGINVAMWNNAATFTNPKILALFRNVRPGIVRIPGGSMSDVYFWNGNGVRGPNNTPNNVDRSRYDSKRNAWKIDYSKWSPGFKGFEGFPKDPAKDVLGTWHGNSDVRDLQNFVKALDADHLVCVNAGTGTPKDAAEWVTWANKRMGYAARYWEIGNELGGDWEAGHIRPDGKPMDGGIYAGMFLKFASAMRKADPTIKIGGPAMGSETNGMIADLLRIAGDQVDFLSWHDYFTTGAGDQAEQLAKLPLIRQNAARVRQMVRKYQPGRADRIEIGLTEWNVKLNSDVDTANLFSGLWTGAALGEMLGSEMDYATLWDGFTQGKDIGGGHGFILEDAANPKAEYWAFYMINNYFGDELLDSTSPSSNLRVYASRDRDGKICVMAVNTSPTRDIGSTIAIKGIPLPAVCESFRLSAAEYKWDPASFSTSWNTGPSRSVLAVPKDAGFVFPAFSVTVLRFGPAADPAGTLKILGPDQGVFIAGLKSKVRVLLLAKDGSPLAGQQVQASIRDKRFVLTSVSTTAADGIAVLEIQAPRGADSDVLAVSAAGLSVEWRIKSVNPSVRLLLPAKSPGDEPVTAEVFLLYDDGGLRPLSGFSGGFVLSGLAAPIDGVFKDGVASVELGRLKTGKYACKASVPGLGLSSDPAEMQIFDLVEKEIVALKFDSDADMTHVSGKGKNSLDLNVRANQGVLSVKLDNYTGWAQDYLNFVKLNEIKSVDWPNVVAVTFDLMIKNNYATESSWANLVFSLQSQANYWMPLKDHPLLGLKKGEWTKIRLDIEKPDWQKAMAQFFQIVVIFNSEKPESGTVYLDNLGFIEKIEKQ